MSDFGAALIAGYILGSSSSLLIVAWNACRLRWHRWSAWEVTPDGHGQWQRCLRCKKIRVEAFDPFSLKVPTCSIVIEPPKE